MSAEAVEILDYAFRYGFNSITHGCITRRLVEADKMLDDVFRYDLTQFFMAISRGGQLRPSRCWMMHLGMTLNPITYGCGTRMPVEAVKILDNAFRYVFNPIPYGCITRRPVEVVEMLEDAFRYGFNPIPYGCVSRGGQVRP
jgi:hypothetical protein